jgi:2-polyprenyl-3-methyl-5-hydroxy-6-metoxy-1,4-benzoquinol methylase
VPLFCFVVEPTSPPNRNIFTVGRVELRGIRVKSERGRRDRHQAHRPPRRATIIFPRDARVYVARSMIMSADNFDYGYTTPTPSTTAYLVAPLMRWIPSDRRLRILDLGSGNGSLAGRLANQGHDVTGVEQSESGIQIARKHFGGARFIKGSIDDLAYDAIGTEFDLVIAIEVIEHLLYPATLLNAARRSLRNGGHVILSTPYHGYLKNLALAATGKLDGHFTALWDGGHVKFFSVSTLSTLVNRTGFDGLEFQFAGRIPFLWKSMLCRARSTTTP